MPRWGVWCWFRRVSSTAARVQCARPFEERNSYALGGGEKCTSCALRDWPKLRRSLLTALVVGTLLVAINQGNIILRGDFPAALYWKIPLTYSVPFLVATWGALVNTRLGAMLVPQCRVNPVWFAGHRVTCSDHSSKMHPEGVVMRCLGRCVLLLVMVVASILATVNIETPVASADGPLLFQCHFDITCPEITIAGDPVATWPDSTLQPFRGYGDPSIERDPATGALWMSYSWLDVLVSSPGPPPVFDFGVRTHLARSDDNGATWTYVRAVNQTTSINHPDTAAPGWTQHEVSTLAREPAGSWQLLWLTYFDALGMPAQGAPDGHSDPYYEHSLAAMPGGLGDASAPWARGAGTSTSFGAQYNLSALQQLADCVGFTEPAIFVKDGATYLATNCVVVDGSGRRDDLERLVLLRQEAAGYSYVGTLLTHTDAVDLGGSRIEQADISFSKSGAVILIATPIKSTAPNHLGCVVFEISNIASAQVRRDAGGHAVQLGHITGDDNVLGPGLCTYDPASTTGVLIVMHAQSTPNEMVFSMHATGVHPDVAAPVSVGGVATAPELPAVAGVRDHGARRCWLVLPAGLLCVLAGGAIVRQRRSSPVPSFVAPAAALYTPSTGDDGDEYADGAVERVRAWCEPDAAATVEDPSRAGSLNADGN